MLHQSAEWRSTTVKSQHGRMLTADVLSDFMVMACILVPVVCSCGTDAVCSPALLPHAPTPVGAKSRSCPLHSYVRPFEEVLALLALKSMQAWLPQAPALAPGWTSSQRATSGTAAPARGFV